MSNENIYTTINPGDVVRAPSPPGGKRNAAGGLDKIPPDVLPYPRWSAGSPDSSRELSETIGKFTSGGYFCAQETVMPIKRSSPLNNPRQEKASANTTYPCPYCKWVGYSVKALNYHVNSYHESVVAAEGVRARERGRVKDYGLPCWSCNGCGYRVGPALLSDRYGLCQKWQDIMETGRKCDGVLSEVV
jgi:hypothetical protein